MDAENSSAGGLQSVAACVEIALRDPDFRRAREAVQALLALDHDHAAVVATLTAGLRDADAAVRRRAAQALGKLGAAGAAVVEHLQTAVRDASWTVREAVVLALGEQPVGASAVRALLIHSALHDASPLVRTAAARAAVQHGADPTADMGVALRHAHAAVRRRAVEVLRHYPPATPDVVPLLLTALEDSHIRVRLAAVRAVGERDESAASGVPRLLRCAFDGDARLRQTATAGLQRLLTLPTAAPLRWLVEERQTVPDAQELLRRGLEQADAPAAVIADFQAVCQRRRRWYERLRSAGEGGGDLAAPPWEAVQAALNAAGANLDVVAAARARRREAAWLLSNFCERWLQAAILADAVNAP